MVTLGVGVDQHGVRNVPGDPVGIRADESDEMVIALAMDHLGINSDAELEEVAGLAKNTLSKARRLAQPLSAVARAKLYYLLGEPWARQALSKLFGPKGQLWLAGKSRVRRNGKC